MKRRKYIEERGITKAEFARRAKITVQTLNNIEDGYDCLLSHVVSILKECEGKVSLDDFLPIKKRKNKK